MARISFTGGSKYALKLQQMERYFISDAPLEKAVAAGSAIVADQIRANLEALPEDEFRNLGEREIFHGLPKGQKKDLLDSFGLTPIEKDKGGFIHTKAGFDGYGSFPTNDYPEGVPNPLLARSVESGSSVRQKTPFVEPAVKATRKDAVEAMNGVIEDEFKSIF